MDGKRGARHVTGRRMLLVVAGATVIALAAGSVAFAADRATSSPSTTKSGATKTGAAASRPAMPRLRAPWGGPLGRPGFGPGPIFGGGLLGGFILHGQAVVPKRGGGYETVAMQRGTVRSVTSTAITVKSADGYTKTYAVTAATLVDASRDGIATVKTGHTVVVLATVASSGTATAVRIDDVTVERSAAHAWAPGPPAGATTGSSVAAERAVAGRRAASNGVV